MFCGCDERHASMRCLPRSKCGGLLEVAARRGRHSNRLRLQNGEPLLDSPPGPAERRVVEEEWFCGTARGNIVSLWRRDSPLIRSDAFARLLGFEIGAYQTVGTSHTGSFKDLGMTVLVSMGISIRSKVRPWSALQPVIRLRHSRPIVRGGIPCCDSSERQSLDCSVDPTSGKWRHHHFRESRILTAGMKIVFRRSPATVDLSANSMTPCESKARNHQS